MRPCLASTIALAALLAPVLACLGNTENDTTTTGSSSSTTEVDPPACVEDGICKPGDGENATNCMADCFCGNGDIETGEECDDGNKTPGDGCGPACQEEATKCDNDGIKEDGEACDDGNAANNDACLVSCNVPSCGDGFTIGELYGDEECDDGGDNGNTKACTEQCTFATCGDGFVHEGVEECDEGPMNDNTAACTSQCKIATCGDGLVQDGKEDCDDGNAADDDTCTSDCKITICGDGIVQAPNGTGDNEACDDGNTDETDTCDVECKAIIHRKVFLSSGEYKGNAAMVPLNGLTGADTKCNALAGAAKFTGKFKAWLSDSMTSPAKRFDTAFTGVYELPDGKPIAQGWTGLMGNLQNPINTTEMNEVLPTDTAVWTNTGLNGEAVGMDNCMEWKGTGDGAYGVASAVAPDWTMKSSVVCSVAARIYCFEDPR